jgi:glycosyltransferase involved in cell wall biosynthesis
VSASGDLISVVLCTYNRAHRVEAAVRAILDQDGAAFELIVVDDGSVDDTPQVLAGIDDDRLRVVRQPNGGLSRARNTGLAEARGDWVTFIDDDDRAEPGWLATFRRQVGPGVGVVCCGATFVTADGRVLFEHHPLVLGGPYGPGTVGSWLAGTFAVRTSLARRAGGYLNGLGNRHQSELFIRLLSVAADEGLRLTYIDELKVRIEALPPTDRRDVNPRRLYDATRWILARHVQSFAGHAAARGALEGVAGINAARLGEWAPARRRLLRSLRASPRAKTAWGRLALVCVPVVGERVWHRHGSWEKPGHLKLGVLDQSGEPVPGEAPELFLAWGYTENVAADRAARTPGPATARPGAVASTPVRRLAERLARRRGSGGVVTVSADGTLPDLGSAAGGGEAPGLVVCEGAIERVDDPVAVLRDLARATAGAPVLVTAVDRGVTDPDRPLGPPTDPGRRREWTYDQLELLLHSAGFAVDRSWRVATAVPLAPGTDSPNAAVRWARDRIRRRRSGMVFLVCARRSAP